MSSIYVYVVDRDFGFAPNPFHGICSLATCKPSIRNTSKIGDWVIGLGGSRLKATGKCIFAMKITEKVTFNDYWTNTEFQDKKPVRNGSKKMLLGDNIYFFNEAEDRWTQAHSHHSNSDGSMNEHNKNRDTTSSMVLLSKHFYYFGSSAPLIPAKILDDMKYKNGIGHRKFAYEFAKPLVDWLEEKYSQSLNLVMADPYDFDKSDAHYSVNTNRITT